MSTHASAEGARDAHVDAAARSGSASTSPATANRSVSREIEIAAPPTVVWKALTDAEELVRWFPMHARVEPGAGGSIRMSWDNVSELDDTRIDVWEPERHLRTMGRTGSWVGIVTDYHLQAGGPGTVLRVVSSGFGRGEDWDSLLDAFGSGWDFELRGLRHYLERHRGKSRTAVWARARYGCTDGEAWKRLAGEGGWLGASGLRDLREGERWAATTMTGDRLSGAVHSWYPPRQFSGTVTELGDALLRVHLYDGSAYLWLSTYELPVDTVRSLQESWQRSLTALFPQ
ncbi:MAG TPA: SRPBCC domain-containing protein [Gemmatimonadaceae bacterium]|nr:SRPBCC domain-containing protein [Gemmatimonadaceae bacterium]